MRMAEVAKIEKFTANAMRNAVPRLDILGGSPEAMQAVLETVAYVM